MSFWKTNRKALGVMSLAILTILWQSGLIDNEMATWIGSGVALLTGARMVDKTTPAK